MQPTVLLITSPHRGWRRLRPLLQKSPEIHVVGAVEHAAQALPEVARLQPAVLLVAADVPGRPLVALLRDLHDASPTSKIIVLGDEASLQLATLLALGRLGAAYLMWADLRAETVPHCLPVVVEDDLVIGSRAVLELHLNPPERRQRPRQAEVVLTERQRVILQGLAAGLKRTEIARMAYCSVRTVDREISTLQEQLGASSEFTLGVRAGQWGFVS